jgi:hypothetical protein
MKKQKKLKFPIKIKKRFHIIFCVKKNMSLMDFDWEVNDGVVTESDAGKGGGRERGGMNEFDWGVGDGGMVEADSEMGEFDWGDDAVVNENGVGGVNENSNTKSNTFPVNDGWKMEEFFPTTNTNVLPLSSDKSEREWRMEEFYEKEQTSHSPSSSHQHTTIALSDELHGVSSSNWIAFEEEDDTEKDISADDWGSLLPPPMNRFHSLTTLPNSSSAFTEEEERMNYLRKMEMLSQTARQKPPRVCFYFCLICVVCFLFFVFCFLFFVCCLLFVFCCLLCLVVLLL